MKREELIAKIEDAFGGVTLEDGVGLHEGQGLDDRLSKEQCARLRIKDEKEDWHNIPILDLYLCHTSLHYFDAKGMRFHLPQILLWALGVYDQEDERLYLEDLIRYGDPPSILFALTHVTGKWQWDYYFSALNTKQIECCIGFLEWYAENVDLINDGLAAKEKFISDDLAVIQEAMPVWSKKLSDMR